MPGARLFWDSEVKEEMLELRRQGYTFSDIARKYGADHSTIIFHCRAAGLALTGDQKREMFDLIKEGQTVEEVGEQLGVDGSVIELYCIQHGVHGSKQFPTKGEIKKLELLEGQMNAQEIRDIMKRADPVMKILCKTDKRGAFWRTDERGEWICLGRLEYKRNVSVTEKKERLNQKRLEMLRY